MIVFILFTVADLNTVSEIDCSVKTGLVAVLRFKILYYFNMNTVHIHERIQKINEIMQ